MKGGVTRRIRTVVIVALLTVGLGLATIRVCADGGAMAAAYRTCECRGWEWQLYDPTGNVGRSRLATPEYRHGRGDQEERHEHEHRPVHGRSRGAVSRATIADRSSETRTARIWVS